MIKQLVVEVFLSMLALWRDEERNGQGKGLGEGLRIRLFKLLIKFYMQILENIYVIEILCKFIFYSGVGYIYNNNK